MTEPTGSPPPDDAPGGRTDPDRPILGLLLAHQRRGWRGGERAPVETYLAQQPWLEDDAEAVLDLIYGEIVLREEAGESPRLEEYLARFPHLAPQLRLQFDVEAALCTTPPAGDGEDPTLLSGDPAPFLAVARPEIPGYEILGELGRGGMGVVYKARQARLNRMVALKMILAGEHARAETAIRFLGEAEAVARLHHPHIVQVFAFGEHGGLPYFEMEYVAGGSLADQLDGTPRPPRDAARLVETLARAIHEVHRLGIVHRDLKPANILLTEDGSPKIADFGLAKWMDVETGLTRTDHVLGSPSYMAPEQARRGHREVGPAADVYALGSILYELLTGRPPFRAATVLETLEQVQSLEPIPPTRLQPKVPRDLETICLTCLRKEPPRRYAGADALAEDLRRFGSGEPIRARPAGPAERAWRWCRRRPVPAALGASVVLLLLVIAAGATWAILSLRHERDLAKRAERWALKELWESYADQAWGNRLSRQAGQRFESLGLLAKAARINPTPKLRDDAIACLALTDLRVVREWEGYPLPKSGIAFDAPLDRYARSDVDGNISVRLAADDSEILRLPAPEPPGPADLAFSPDGRFLAATHVPPGDRPPRHRVWDLSRGAITLELQSDVSGARLAFSPDGRRIAAGLPDHRLGIYDVETASEVRRLEGLPVRFMAAFHPLGRLLAISGPFDGEVEVRDIDAGTVVAKLTHPGGVTGLAWSADGSALAAGCEDRQIYLWDVATSRTRAVLKGHNNSIISLAFHPSEDLLASGSYDGTTRLWDPWTGKQLLSASGMPVRFDRDGKRLAYENAPTVGIWEVATGDCYRLLRPGWAAPPPPVEGPPGNVSVAIGPGGRLLAAAGLDGVRIWDLSSAGEVAHLRLGFSGGVLFHPRDGSLITYGTSGLCRWPIGPAPDGATGPLRVGPASILDPSARSDSYHACLSRDGGLLAVGDRPNRQALVLEVDRPGEKARFGDHPGINAIALSPDGRWVAAGSRQGSEIKVWDRATGDLLARLPDSGTAGFTNPCVAFSPDGRWLVTGSQGDYRFWRTGSWELGRTIRRDRVEEMPGLIAFAHDGRSLATTPSPGTVRLIEADTGRTLANLSAPDPHEIRGLGFSPDDTQLAAAIDDPTVQLWDLRKIRRHLAAMQLDWDPPPDPPDTAEDDPARTSPPAGRRHPGP